MQNTEITMNSFCSEFELYVEKWSMPEGEPFTRTSLLCDSLLSTVNTVTKVFFTLVSLIPGSNSKWVKEKIDIDGLARKGFESLMKSEKGRFKAEAILPTIFKAVALTLNPYAIVRKAQNAELNKINCYSELLIIQANQFAKAGMSARDLVDSTGDISFEMETITKDGEGNDLEDLDEYFHTSRISSNKEEISKAEKPIEPWKQWIIKEIGTRVLYFAATLAILIEKTIYLAFGILVAANALCLGFKFKKVNQLAMKYLRALDVIDDVCTGLRATFFPREFIIDSQHIRTPKK